MADTGTKFSGIRGFEFQNWSKTFSCKPEVYFEPTSTEEIQQILEEALKQKKKVKVIGSGYSPSDITCTSEFMICMKNYNKILNVNKEKLQVTVQAGITLHDFEEKLRQHGMAVSLMPAVSSPSLGGAIATGTHGTGVDFGTFATSVIGLTLLTGRGTIIRCSEEENPDVFNAARCHLGAMGVILDVTWQCEKAYRLYSVRRPGKLSEVLDDLDNEITQSEHGKLMWWPHTDNVTIFRVGRTQKPVKTHKSWFWNYLIGFHLLQFLYWLSSFFPWLIKFINKYHFSWLSSDTVEVVDVSEKVFTFDCLFHQYVTEWAIPREKTSEALKRLRKWLDESGFYAHMPVEIRFAKGDDIYLSPAYGRDTCFINIIMYRPYGKVLPREDYWNFYEDLMLSVGGRPHWAKAHKLGPQTLHTLYPRFDDFRNICRKLDPDETFINDYLQRTIFHH